MNMKLVCDFCKTEYNLDNFTGGKVRCALCGNVWTVKKVQKTNYLFVFIAALCALLSAVIFALVVVIDYKAKDIKNNPLVASLEEVSTIDSEDGNQKFVIKGTVKNRSQNMYGVPDLIVSSLNEEGKIIYRQKFMAPATILDAGKSVSFEHVLDTPLYNVAKITVKLEGQ